MSTAQHHLHLRERGLKNSKDTPAIKIMDHLIYVMGLAIPLMTVPQLTELYLHHNAGSISLITWSGYFVGSCFWFTYGILHKAKPIYLTNFLTAFIQLAIVVGILMYR